MSERTVTVNVDVTVQAEYPEQAELIVGHLLQQERIGRVRVLSSRVEDARTWDDDCADGKVNDVTLTPPQRVSAARYRALEKLAAKGQ